jgi:hypothetical protein
MDMRRETRTAERATYLDTIDDFEATTLVDHANIASVQPSLLVNGLFSVCLVYKES